ncbi:MAG: hypothetical protein ACPGR6_07350 [Candidatus Puniceispirillaceae bacterium]
MTSIIILKFFHYLGLFLAGGLGVAGAILAKNHQKAGMKPAAPVQASIRMLARIGMAAIILLWGTGIALTYLVYASFDLGWAFHIKLLGASLLLLVLAGLNIHLNRSAKAGTPPNPAFMKAVPMISRGALVLVLIGVAILTSS